MDEDDEDESEDDDEFGESKVNIHIQWVMPGKKFFLFLHTMSFPYCDVSIIYHELAS